jgi:hypothetical protein
VGTCLQGSSVYFEFAIVGVARYEVDGGELGRHEVYGDAGYEARGFNISRLFAWESITDTTHATTCIDSPQNLRHMISILL